MNVERRASAAARVSPRPGEPTLQPPACDPIPDPGSTTPTSLGQPNNLHVTPFRNRRAVLLIGGLQRPGGDTSVDRSDVKLSQCPAGKSDSYGILVHEVGHALGLRSADGSDVHHRLSDSVMSGGNYSEKCSPYPLDVLAIRALYETR